MRVHLCTLNDGEPHPCARVKVLSYTFASGNGVQVEAVKISITGSRLAVLKRVSDIPMTRVVVWDWMTGQILLVRQLYVDRYTLMEIVHLGTR